MQDYYLEVPTLAEEPWSPNIRFEEIVEAIGLKGHTSSVEALKELVYLRDLEMVMDAGMVSFLQNYPWRYAFITASMVVDEALARHATPQGELKRVDQAVTMHIMVDGEWQPVPYEPQTPEDYVVLFAHKMLSEARQMEDEKPEAIKWFPKNLRQVLALSFAVMLWMYLDQLTPTALAWEPAKMPYWQALTYVRLCFRCVECGSRFENPGLPENGLRICCRRPELEEGEILESPCTE